MANQLREYVDARLEFVEAISDQGRSEQAAARAERIQDECWSLAVAFAQKEPRPTANLLLDSLNQMIDLESKRTAAMANHVPETVIYVVALVSLFASVMVGYCYGTGKIRHPFSTSLLSLAIVVVLLVILDLDRPREGFIRISQRAMLQLRDRMRAAPH